MNILGIIASQTGVTGLPVSGAALWLDGDDASTFSFSSGTRVSEWRDKTANARNFTQATTASQPDRNVTQNSKTAVKFAVSGAAYFLSNASYDWSASAFTMLVVTDFKGGNYVATVSRNSVGSLALGSNLSSANMAISRVGQATASSNLTASGVNQYTYKSAGISSGNVSVDVYKNGTAGSASLTLGSLGAGNKCIIGGSQDAAITDTYGTDGYICELIIYPSQLSDSDRGSVETYLKNKWGTP